MSSELDVTRVVRSWLRTDEHESADRVLDDVLALLDATPQRRSTWPARRIADMNLYAKLAIAIAAVVVVAVVGINLLPASGGVGGGPAATPSPSPSPRAAPSASPGQSAAPASGWTTGSLVAGHHDAALQLCDPRGPQFGCAPNKVAFSFDLPSGKWSSKYEGILDVGTVSDSFAWMWFMGPVHTVSTDPCAGLSSPVGQSVDELATALTTIAGTDAVGPTDLTVGGVPGKLVELTIHDDISCGVDKFWLLGNVSLYPNALGSKIKLRILEVHGSPFIVYSDQAGRDQELEQEIEQVVESIQFD